SEDELLEADMLDMDDGEQLDGLYIYGKLNSCGNGSIVRSLECPPLYYAKKEDGYCISSRIFTISKLFDFDTINRKHVASHIELQNMAVTDETIYENIYFIPFGTEISISDKLELEFKPDFLYDERLNKLYAEDPEKYWDECYQRIASQVNAFAQKGLMEHLSIGITGGMDSRLLLSLYHNHVKEAFTAGPVYSPEVFIGKMICDTLDIEHKTPALKQTAQSENLLRRMSIHIFDREFEMSPWDLGRIFPKSMDGIRLDGHEYLKQDAFTADLTVDEVLEKSKKEIAHNDIITSEYSEKIIRDDIEFERKYAESMKDIKKYPKIKKILNRGRWFSAAHETEFNHRFNLLPLASDTLVKYNYNGSIDSINNLECHVELIRRSNPELLEIPLFNNQFTQNPVPPIDNKVPGRLNYKNLYLVKYYDHIHKYIEDNYHLIKDIVKESFIDELTLDNIEGNVRLSQKVYNILEAIVLFKTEDACDLKEELDVDFEVEDEENLDTTDEDTIKAFIAYNKDIVRLKREKDQENTNLENVNQLTKNMEDKEKLIEILYKNKRELEEKAEELYAVINDKNRQIRDLDKFNNDKAELIDKLKENNTVLKEKYQQLEDEKKIMVNSTSWKITKPIRTISDKVKKE
ncbi:MAG: hypothetical protein Q4Q22_05820, partial [Methanosphaera sp.]|nr:hypothetical protein [Methanosphaera sp.]